jgi:hypothetical protein
MRQNAWQHSYQVAGRSCLSGVVNKDTHSRCYLMQLQGNVRISLIEDTTVPPILDDHLSDLRNIQMQHNAGPILI